MAPNADLVDWKVLIIDDDPDNIGVPQKLLTFYGAQVFTAEDGAQGLEVLRKMPVLPTVILMDLSMPVMDGWEMLKALRADQRLTDLTVIALTAHAMPTDKDRALAAGFDGYIVKPIRIHTILDEIRQCIAQSKAKKK